MHILPSGTATCVACRHPILPRLSQGVLNTPKPPFGAVKLLLIGGTDLAFSGRGLGPAHPRLPEKLSDLRHLVDVAGVGLVWL